MWEWYKREGAVVGHRGGDGVFDTVADCLAGEGEQRRGEGDVYYMPLAVNLRMAHQSGDGVEEDRHVRESAPLAVVSSEWPRYAVEEGPFLIGLRFAEVNAERSRSCVIERTFKGSLHRFDHSVNVILMLTYRYLFYNILDRDPAGIVCSSDTIHYAVSRNDLGSNNADIASSFTSTRPTVDLISTRELRVSTVYIPACTKQR